MVPMGIAGIDTSSVLCSASQAPGSGAASDRRFPRAPDLSSWTGRRATKTPIPSGGSREYRIMIVGNGPQRQKSGLLSLADHGDRVGGDPAGIEADHSYVFGSRPVPDLQKPSMKPVSIPGLDLN